MIYPQRVGAYSALTVSVLAVATVWALVWVVDIRSANPLALCWLAALAIALLAFVARRKPIIPLAIALVILGSPLALLLDLRWSAAAAGFFLWGAALGLVTQRGVAYQASDALFKPMLVFLGYGFVSAVIGFLHHNSLSYVLGDFFQIAEFAGIYVLVSCVVTNEKQARTLLSWALGAVVVTCVGELVLFFMGATLGNLMPEWEGGSTSEILVRTIDFDSLILFAVLLNLQQSIKRRGWQLLARILLLCVVLNITLSLGRGLWLASLITVVISIVLSPLNRGRLVKVSGLVAASILLVAALWQVGGKSDGSLFDVFQERVFHGVDQVSEGIEGTDSLATRRFMEFAIVTPEILQSPILGHGQGATYVIEGFAVLNAGTSGLIDNHFLHNLYLTVSFRMGAVGLLLLLWILLRYFRRATSIQKGLPAGVNKAVATGLIAGVGGHLLLSVTQPTILNHPTCGLVACAMALTMNAARWANVGETK